MRNSYVVTYDISDEKRLRKVFKTMRAFGDHLQLSVFECQLTPRDLVRLRAEAAAAGEPRRVRQLNGALAL